jgi:hypothetical protein
MRRRIGWGLDDADDKPGYLPEEVLAWSEAEGCEGSESVGEEEPEGPSAKGAGIQQRQQQQGREIEPAAVMQQPKPRADANMRLLLGLLDEGEGQQEPLLSLVQQQLQQHIRAVLPAPVRQAGGGTTAAAAAAPAAGGAGGPAVFCSDPAKLQAMCALVAEDIQRIAQDWQHRELHKLQANAASIWQRCATPMDHCDAGSSVRVQIGA